MDYIDLERLGLNKNEAKVYYSLLIKGEATAQELVKSLGVYRNIVYDNLEKLKEKGLISFINIGPKRKFIAEKPTAILDFMENKQEELNKKIIEAREMIPMISNILGKHNSKQNVTVFNGIAGMKKILREIVEGKQTWAIGITNESVKILGETYWVNYNLRKKDSKTEEWLLWNSNFTNTVIAKNIRSRHRILPKELDQVTETILWNGKVAIFVFSVEPIVIVIESEEVFKTYRKHFDFLWKMSKEIKN